MKIKIIQKMLAIIIATSTVIATPGLASAMPPRKRFLQNKTNRSREDSEKKEEKFKKTNDIEPDCVAGGDDEDEKKFELEAGSKQKNNNCDFSEIQSLVKKLSDILEKKSQVRGNHIEKIIKKLTEKENLYDQEKKIFETLFGILNNRLIQNFNAGCCIKLLSRNVDNPDVKNVVFDCFCLISSEFQFNQTYFKDILKILSFCCDNEYTRKCGANIINNLYGRGFFVDCSKDQALKIVDIVLNCSNENGAKQNLVDLIVDFAKKNFLEKYPQEKVTKLVDVMIDCSNDKNARSKVIDGIGLLFRQGAFENCSEEQILKIIDMLNNLSKENDIKGNIATVLKDLTRHLASRKRAREYMPSMVNILDSCSNDNDAKVMVASSINFFTQLDFIKSCCKKEILSMTNILNICSNNINAKRHILDSVLTLSDRNLLKNYSKEEAAGVIRILFQYVNDDEMVKKYGLSVLKLIYQWSSKNWTNDDIAIIIYGFNQYAKDNEIKKQFLNFVENSLEKDSVDDFSSQRMTIIFDMLNKCSHDDDVKKNVAQVVFKLASKGLLEKFSTRENMQIINILNRCVENNNSSKISKPDEIYIKNLAYAAIDSIFSKCDLNGVQEEEIALILETLDKCAQVKEIQNNVLNSIINGLLKDIFQNLKKDSFVKILNILDKCCDNGDSKANVANIISLLFEKDIFKENFHDQMIKILNILNRCIENDDAKSHILKVSAVLIDTGYFAGDSEGMLKAVNLMAECAVDYADLKIKTLKYMYILNVHHHFYNCSQAESVAIVDILNKFVCDPKMTKYVLYNLSNMALKNALVNYPQAKASQIMDMLSKLIDNSKLPESELKDREVAQNVLDIILFLFHNRFLREFSHEQIEYMLGKCCNSDSTRKYFVIANYFLTNGSKTSMRELIETLNGWLDEGGRELEVSHMVLNIVWLGHFNNCSQEEIKSLINILHRCSNDSSTRIKVLYSTACLINSGLLDNFLKDEKKLLTQIIYGCFSSDSYNAQNYLINIIASLLSKNFFENNLTEIEPIVQFMDKCANINEFKSKILMLACKVIFKQLLINCEKGPIINILDRCVNLNGDNKFLPQAIRALSEDRLAGALSSDDISKALEVLEKCAAGKCDDVHSIKYIASAIKYLILKENWCMGNVSKYESFRVMKLLDFCINHKNMNGSIYFFKPNILISVGILTLKRLQQGLCGAEIEKIVDLLARCLDDHNARVYVEGAFSVLISDEFGDEIIKKIDILLTQDVENGIKNNFITVIYNLVKNNFMKNYSKNQISNILKILHLCNKNDMEKLYIGNIALLLIANDYFKNCSTNEVLQVLNLLNMCSDLEIVQDNAIFIIYKLINDGLLKDISSEEMSVLIDMLSEFGKKAKIRIEFTNIFDKLLATDFFKYGMGKTIDILEKIDENDENHKNIINIIEKLIDKKCLDNATESEIARITDILIRYLENNQLRLGSLKCICKLLVNNYSNNLPKDTTKKIINALNYTYGDCESKKLAANLLTFLAYRDCLNGWSEDEIFQTVSILYKCLDSQDANENVLQAFVSLSTKNCFSGGSVDKTEKIIEVLDKISNNTAAKPFIAKIIEQLAIYGSFKKYPKDGVSKIINIIGQCCSEEISRKFSANAMDQLENQGLIEQRYKNTLKNWWNIPSKF